MFEVSPNEYGGYELDTLRIMAAKVGAKFKFDLQSVWFQIKMKSDGTPKVGKFGVPIFVGTYADVYYRRATFAVAHHFFQEELSFTSDFLIHSTQTWYYRTSKPGVSLKNLKS